MMARVTDGRQAKRPGSLWCLGMVLCLHGFVSSTGWSQDLQSELDDEYRAGLLAQYRAEDGTRCQRIDSRLAFSWPTGSPDPRLGPGPFAADWQGYLMSQVPGKYRVAAYVQGQLKLEVAGQVMLEGSQWDRPGWLVSKSVELPFDWHAVQVTYRSRGSAGQLVVYWSGPGFQWEPIGSRQWYHDPEKTPQHSFERGHQLVRAMRCSQCHEIPGQAAPLAAPSLQHFRDTLDPAWLIERLTQDPALQAEGQRMPGFQLGRQEAEAIVAYLDSQSKPVSLEPQDPVPAASNKKKGNKKGKAPRTKPDAEIGHRLFMTVGCLACHQVEELGTDGLFGGGSLASVAAKRPAGFFVPWLEDPSRFNRDHRMPRVELTPLERADLGRYLEKLGDQDKSDTSERKQHEPGEIELGKQLVAKYRCTSCHETTDTIKPAEVTRNSLSVMSSWQDGCTEAQGIQVARPVYRLAKQDREAITHYVASMAGVKRVKKPVQLTAPQVLREQNCLACHARYREPGIAVELPAVAKAHPELAGQLSAMTPPSLNSVGDKLPRAVLQQAIRREGPIYRPWLQVRMPRFALTEQEVNVLADHLVQVDRIPTGGPTSNAKTSSDVSSRVVQAAGRRLVTTAGFGCTSCHEVGGVKPVKAPLNALGPDLTGLSKRIRREWFDRWVRNPARMVPRMEMPSIKIAVRGVLDDHLDHQLDAVWQVLNQPGFKPPPAGAVRIVRRSGVPARAEQAAVLTDVLHVGEKVYTKPLLVGLSNRHNVLYDLATNRLVGWWQGDVAHQRTRGKTWFWDVPERSWVQARELASQVQLQLGDRRLVPLARGQFLTELESWEYIPGGLRFHRRLAFAPDPDARLEITIVETLTAREFGKGLTGFQRDLQVSGVPREATLLVHCADVDSLPPPGVDLVNRQVNLIEKGISRVAVTSPGGKLDREGWLALSANADQVIQLQLTYSSDFPVDQFPQVLPPAKLPEPMAIEVVPGFDAIRLPLVANVMPTAMSWAPDGRMFFTSLKGRIWQGSDTNGDGREDQWRPWNQELAAPFGIVAYDRYVDVVNKYALLRLFDQDRDGRVERVAKMASGWGHTTDYHDWAVGLPRDQMGNYYVATACQQDDRSKAAAHLRGKVLKLSPVPGPTGKQQGYAIEKLTGGHRFPTGIARNRQGQLFVTDNQGNYNPFNELNHVVPGKRYGFLNKQERQPGFSPPLTAPAIDIPHPWTRSVNGICFLETPGPLRKAGQGMAFGPFEGHLVGCEYDTRRLVRMSLQQVGGTIQGAVYPFSFDVAGDRETFLGPLSCAVSPRGELYVGNIRDSGWGGGNNIGSLVQLRYNAKTMVAGIAEVRVFATGFEILFTRPVDQDRAADLDSYSLISYTRVSTPAYGGSDQQRRVEKPMQVTVASDGMSARLDLAELRAGFVYELRLKNLASKGQTFHPAEAYYTVRTIPR